MAEYIKRDVVMKEIMASKWMDGYDGATAMAIAASAPAADVAPVRHGRWVPFHSSHAGEIQYCSVCDIGCTWKPDYCPNCGAKMDGGTN